jgi:arginine decarboxylase
VFRIVGFKLDVKEIHGYRPDLGLSVFTQAALDRRTAARGSTTDSSE